MNKVSIGLSLSFDLVLLNFVFSHSHLGLLYWDNQNMLCHDCGISAVPFKSPMTWWKLLRHLSITGLTSNLEVLSLKVGIPRMSYNR